MFIRRLVRHLKQSHCLEHLKKPLGNLGIMSEQRLFWGALAESARAEGKNHRGTEGTEKACDLCLRALSGSNVLTEKWFC